MGKRARLNRTLNIFNLCISIFIFSTGMILFIKFHIGEGAYRMEWLGLGRGFWVGIHQASALGFLFGFAAHIQMHWKYIRMVAKRWRANLPKKRKSTTYQQILLLIVALFVMWAGFYPWMAMPGATLEVERYHAWIDVHKEVGIFFL